MVRILIIDDQKIVREGIKILLKERVELEIVGDAADSKEGLEKIKRLKPDVVLLDIDMPKVSGLVTASKINDNFPDTKVIMLSSHEDQKYVQQATESGAKGYLLKNVSSQELEWSIKLVSQGYSAIKSELLEKQFKNQKKPELNLNLDEDLRTDNKQVSSTSTTTLSAVDKENLNQLELLLAKKKVKEQHPKVQKKRQKKNPLFHQVKLSQLKKTMMSFEFKLLVLITLFCLGFLAFIALSGGS